MSEPVSKGHRSGFVAIVGRPSAGKSTLVNTLCGHKVSIIAPVPQTTRNRVRGIVTRPEGQLVFVDTPGFHTSVKKFNNHMSGLIQESIRDADLVLYVADATRAAGDEEHQLMKMVESRSARIPTVIAINKVDKASVEMVAAMEQELRVVFPKAQIVYISALKGDGVDNLIKILISQAPQGEQAYPPDFYTDQPPEFRVAELIREKAIRLTKKEVPHSLYVEIADMEIRKDEAGREQLWIRAFILVERNSQQGIVVGKGGEKIKEIRQSAQKEIAALFPYRIHLDLRVKVNSNWRHDEQLLKRLVN